MSDRTVQFLVERPCPEAQNNYLTPEIAARLPFPVWVLWPGDPEGECACGAKGFYTVPPTAVNRFDKDMGIQRRPNTGVTVSTCMGRIIE